MIVCRSAATRIRTAAFRINRLRGVCPWFKDSKTGGLEDEKIRRDGGFWRSACGRSGQRSGCDPYRAAAAQSGAAPATSGQTIRVGWWIPPLGRRPLRMGARIVCPAPAPRSPLGAGPLDTPARWLVLAKRALALKAPGRSLFWGANLFAPFFWRAVRPDAQAPGAFAARIVGFSILGGLVKSSPALAKSALAMSPFM
jgi:hypothetical protein